MSLWDDTKDWFDDIGKYFIYVLATIIICSIAVWLNILFIKWIV